MKNIFKILLAIIGITIYICLNPSFVFASELTETFSGYYWDRKNEDGSYHGSGSFRYYYVDGMDSYCLDPTVHEGSPIYVGEWGQTGLPDSIRERISLIAYYGYNYPGHQTLEYRAATQAMIWETVTGAGNRVIFTTERFGEGTELDISKERKEIESLVSSNSTLPSFIYQTHRAQVGQKIILEDTSHVLERYNVNLDGYEYDIVDNKIIITPKGDLNISGSVNNKYAYNTSYMVFVSDIYQSQVVPGNVTSSLAFFEVDLYYGRLDITKFDVDNVIKQGEATLAGAKYGVYRRDTDELITTIVTDENGNASTGDILPVGKYYVMELESSKGYELDQTKYYFEMNGDHIVHIDVQEQVIKGKIKVRKLDNETNSCNLDFIGSKYQVLNQGGIVVDTLVIGDDCTAISKELPYGNYKVKEIEGPINYDLDSNIYDVYIHDKSEVEVTSLEKIIKGKIKVRKLDNETNFCNPDFIGAKYQVLNQDGIVVDTLVIGDDCEAISKELPYGNYKVKEIEGPVNYELDTNIYDVYIHDKSKIEVTSLEKIIKGKIKVRKLDNETNSCNLDFIGAKYQVLNQDGIVVDTLVIGDDCTAISKELPYGSYKVKEIEGPINYDLDTNIYDAYIHDKSEVEVTSLEKVIKGKIKVRKLDNETNFCNLDFIGAKYQVLNQDGIVVDTLVIGDDCTAISKELSYGNYKVKEIEGPINYDLDTNIYDVYIHDKSEVEVTSLEKIIQNKITILKQYEPNNKTITGEAGITFEIYHQDGTKYGEVITDENGYTSIDLPYGVWVFHQVNTFDGYQKVDDFKVAVSENSEKEQFYTILNKRISAKLKVIKVDSETKKPIMIKNVGFKILNLDTGEYITEFANGKYIDTFYTNNEGIMTTTSRLDYGKYKLIEIDSPAGYIISNQGLEFTVDESNYEYINNEPLITITFENKPIKGKLEIIKKGEIFVSKDGSYHYDEKVLEGVRFRIYAAEDILSSDGTTLYYKKGKVVDTLVTDEKGYSCSKELYPGKYYVKETKTLDGYILDNDKYYFEINTNDNKENVIYKTYSPINYLKKSSLELTKVDSTTNKAIPNTKISLFTEKDELIFTGITDENGKIIIDNLPLGKYYVLEEEAPSGYILDAKKIYFEIVKSKQTAKIAMENNPIKGSLEFSKIDFSTSEPLPNTKIEIYTVSEKLIFTGKTDINGKLTIPSLKYGEYYILETEAPEGYKINPEKMPFKILEDGKIVKVTMPNERIKSNIKINKVDQDNNVLKGVTIGIYDANDKLIYEGITDENGNIETELEYGNYYYKEIETVDGYILSEEKKYFEVDGSNDALEFTLVNNIERIDVPNTEKNKNLFLNYFSYILIFLGGLIVYETKKV